MNKVTLVLSCCMLFLCTIEMTYSNIKLNPFTIYNGDKIMNRSSDTLRVCVLDYSMPLSSAKKDALSGLSGIYIDIAQQIAKTEGKQLKIHYIKDYYYSRPLRKGIGAGNCSLQMGIPDVKRKYVRKNKILASNPFISLGYVLVSPKDKPIKSINDISRKRVAIKSGSPPITTVLKLNSNLTVLQDVDQAMNKLDSGEVDYAFIWGPRAGYLNKFKYKNKFNIYTTNYQWNAIIGVDNKEEHLLKTTNDLLKNLSGNIKKMKKEYGINYLNHIAIKDEYMPVEMIQNK